ncbi:MAG: Gfo/Idh/MocA family protein [Alphaproteobacteria bacterium]
MGSIVRYGIIGGGTMGQEHVQNIRLLPDAELAAVADPHGPSLDVVRALTDGPLETYDDYRVMLEDAALDAVIIATPNYTHVNVLDDVLKTDKAILVEKPLCTTLEDCRRIEQAVRCRPGLVWVAMEYRYIPPVSRLIEEVRKGTAGKLRMLSIREHRFPFLEKVGDWNRFARNTGGTMVEKCCHYFDLMRLIVQDRPVRIYASGAQDVNHLDERYDGEVPDIIDNAFVIVDFEKGCRAMLDLCMFAEAAPNQEEIVATGDLGRIACTVPDSDVVIGRRNPTRIEREHIPVDEQLLAAGHHHGSTYFAHQAFLKALSNGGQAEVSVHDGLYSVAMGLAAEKSIVEGRPIKMTELGL